MYEDDNPYTPYQNQSCPSSQLKQANNLSNKIVISLQQHGSNNSSFIEQTNTASLNKKHRDLSESQKTMASNQQSKVTNFSSAQFTK